MLYAQGELRPISEPQPMKDQGITQRRVTTTHVSIVSLLEVRRIEFSPPQMSSPIFNSTSSHHAVFRENGA